MPDPVTLDSVFQDTAAAARQAQQSLDLSSYAARTAYAIPRVNVQAEFDFKSVTGRTILIFFGQKSSTEQKQLIQFSLKLTPEPAPPVPDMGDPAMPVAEPPFIVNLAQRQTLLGTLIQSLQTPALVTFAFTDGGTSKPTQEIQRLQDLASSDQHDRGIVFLCLDRSLKRYLIVAIGDHPEGIFVMQDNAVTVYSCRDHSQRDVFFAPFEEMVKSIRAWMAAAMPRVPSTDPDPPAKFGAIDVQPFASGLWSAYRNARAAADPRHSGYDLDGVAAQMIYQSTTGGDDPADGYVGSEVDLRIPDNTALPAVALDLISPEYVVTGDFRDRFLAALAQEFGDLLDRIHSAQKHARGVALYDTYYETALHDQARAQSAVILLSYGRSTPVNEFLVCWPADLEGEEREFAFTCELQHGVIGNFAVVLPLEDPVEGDETIVGEQNPFRVAAISGDPYTSTLHAMHAQRVWDLNGKWILKSLA